MLSVIAGAKRAKKDEAGQAQRLTRLHASLEAAAKEVEARLQKAIQDGIAARDAEGVQKEMRHEIGILKRRIMDVCTSTLQEETVLQRKQLHEKEMFWKLKLETNRVAATAQLRNETRKLEANHETSLRQRLLEQREQLLSGSDGGLRDALQRLDEADEQIHELKRTIAALKHDLKAASVEQLEAAEQAIEARRHNEELQAEAQEEARRVAKLRNELEDSAVQVARFLKELEDFAGAKKEADALRTDMWALQTKAEVMRGRAEAAESARDAAYAERDEYRAEYRDARAQREAFRMELEVAIADLAQARVMAAKAEERMAAKAEERMADMERLTEEVEQKAMDAVGQKLVAAEAVAVAAREQAVKAEQHATTVEQALAASKALVQELQALIDQERAEGGVRAEELATVRAQSQLYERECDKLRAALQAAQAETQLQGARSKEQLDIGADCDQDFRIAYLGQQLKGAAKQISDLQDTLHQVQAASKADRERLIAISLESLSSLRAHLVRSFTGGRRPAVLVNGVDPVPMMVRAGLAKKVESMAAHSRGRMHLMVNTSSVTAATVTIKASVSLPDIPKGARATGHDSGLTVSDTATHGPLPKGKKTEVYSGRPCSYLDVDEEGDFGDFDGGEYVWPDAPGSVGLPPGPGPGPGLALPKPSRTLRNRLPASNAEERDVRNAINKAKANGDPLYTVFYSRLY